MRASYDDQPQARGIYAWSLQVNLIPTSTCIHRHVQMLQSTLHQQDQEDDAALALLLYQRRRRSGHGSPEDRNDCLRLREAHG